LFGWFTPVFFFTPGTIWGIFEGLEECLIDFESASVEDIERSCLTDTLQKGNNLVAAGYCLYSSATSFVMTLGNGVNVFTYDEKIGEFVLTHPNVVIPKRGKIYSFNEANRWDWDPPLQEYITDIQQGLGDTKSRYSSRYIGSMVADIHRTLLYGGIFGYPADKRNRDGKLRLLYEAAPMAFLMEQAGGLALTGKNRIMDIPPAHVHQRVPTILGSPLDVLELRRYYERSNDPELIRRCEARMKGLPTSASASSQPTELPVFE
jgi:fructose-1,6-bisphosphatase I